MIKAQHISTHLLLLLFTLHSFLVYVVGVVYLFIQSAFPRPSITQPNRTTMTLRRQYMMVDNLRSHRNRTVRLFLVGFHFGAKGGLRRTSSSGWRTMDETLNRLMKLLSLPPLLHIVGSSSHGGFSVMTLETANFKMFCKSIPIMPSASAMTSNSSTHNNNTMTNNHVHNNNGTHHVNNHNTNNNSTNHQNANQEERGTKSSLFLRPNGITVLCSVELQLDSLFMHGRYGGGGSGSSALHRHRYASDVLRLEWAQSQLNQSEMFDEFCSKLVRYTCAESLKNRPLLILLNVHVHASTNTSSNTTTAADATTTMIRTTSNNSNDCDRHIGGVTSSDNDISSSLSTDDTIHQNIGGGHCASCPHKSIMGCIARCAFEIIQSRVRPPQRNWTVQCICVKCGKNVYDSFDWICAHMKSHQVR